MLGHAHQNGIAALEAGGAGGGGANNGNGVGELPSWLHWKSRVDVYVN